MAKVSMSQAAKDTGVSLPTLSRWRNSGRISADKKENGGYVIDTSEYDRIKDLKKHSPNMKRFIKEDMKHIATPNENKTLDIEVHLLRERLKQ